MKQCIDSHKVHARLKKIQGQVNGISNMIDQDIPCEDILIQINAVKSAIHKVGQIILETHGHRAWVFLWLQTGSGIDFHICCFRW